MKELAMYSSIGIHLRSDVEAVVHIGAPGEGAVRVGTWENDNFEVTFFGDVDMLRHLAEEFYEAADVIERGERRQRVLDNAPRRRKKFFAEPATNGKEMNIAA